ncbi:hypothetical protein TCON_2034 [Astathelohania contejeani]|uniref:Uncharacterized protein n=1 Tax=Astathelohania contejeani TaxID=164912 RepID=A0ABQ7HX63_9MICR|nr:hypothetical protein TCON_2034 [Thelohania contejeani]
MENCKEEAIPILQQLSRILEEEDGIIAKDMAQQALYDISSRTDIHELALNSIYLKFLKTAFDMFMNDKSMLEHCVTLLSLTPLSQSQASKYGFFEVIDNLLEIEQYKKIATSMKYGFGSVNTEEVPKRRKISKKRVSWPETLAEVRYFRVENEDSQFRHGGYREKDIKEASVLKTIKTFEEEIEWCEPPRLEIEPIQRENSALLEEEIKRQESIIKVVNLDENNTKFCPAEEADSILEESVTVKIPLINLAVRNSLPTFDFKKIIENTESTKIELNQILEDPELIEMLSGDPQV